MDSIQSLRIPLSCAARTCNANAGALEAFSGLALSGCWNCPGHDCYPHLGKGRDPWGFFRGRKELQLHSMHGISIGPGGGPRAASSSECGVNEFSVSRPTAHCQASSVLAV